MSLNEQRLGAFLDARDAASAMLTKEDVRSKRLTLPEALILQAAVDLLDEREEFYGSQAAQLVRLQPTVAYTILTRFTDHDGIFGSSGKGVEDHHYVKCLYWPTEIGKRVLSFFEVKQPSAQVEG